MLGELLHREQWLHEALQAAAIDDALNAGPVAYSLQLVLIDRGDYTRTYEYILVHTTYCTCIHIHIRTYAHHLEDYLFFSAILYIEMCSYCTHFIHWCLECGAEVDYVTPLLEQQTYEGALDEFCSVRLGELDVPAKLTAAAAANKSQMPPKMRLDSSDPVMSARLTRTLALHSLKSCYLKMQIFSQLRCVHLKVIADYIRALSKSNKEGCEVCSHTPDLRVYFFLLLNWSNVCTQCTLYIVNFPRLI